MNFYARHWIVILTCASCYAPPQNSVITHPTDSPIPSPIDTSLAPGFTMVWQSDPNVCLQPSTTGNTDTPVTVEACDGSTIQRWTWQSGGYINVGAGGCLAFAEASVGAAAEVVPCNGAQTWFYNFGGQLFQVVNGNDVMLSPNGTAVGMLFSAQAQEPPTASREWSFNVTDPNGRAGYAITPANNPNLCLTATAKGPLAVPCDQQPTQAWTYANLSLMQGDQCLAADGNGVVTLAACDASQTQLFWLGNSGDIVSDGASTKGTPMCLFANPNGSLRAVPNSTLGRDWIFGAVNVP